MDSAVCDVLPAHLPQIAAMERECFSLPWTQEQLASQLRDAQHEFIAAVDPAGRVLGYAGMLFVLDEGYISNVAVDPAFRRRGIADALIERLCALCRSHALSFATLEVRAGNTAAVSLYSKHGFETVGRRRNYYERPREDALLMTKTWNRGGTA